MKITEQHFKGYVDGSSNQITENETFDKDKLYVINDLPSNCGISNAKMSEVLSNVLIKALINVDDIFICLDEGFYKKGNVYRFTGNDWEDITSGGSALDMITSLTSRVDDIEGNVEDVREQLQNVYTKEEIDALLPKITVVED